MSRAIPGIPDPPPTLDSLTAWALRQAVKLMAEKAAQLEPAKARVYTEGSQALATLLVDYGEEWDL